MLVEQSLTEIISYVLFGSTINVLSLLKVHNIIMQLPVQTRYLWMLYCYKSQFLTTLDAVSQKESTNVYAVSLKKLTNIYTVSQKKVTNNYTVSQKERTR